MFKHGWFHLGLNHERNLRKIRILTFISLVNKHDEIAFEELSKELNINVENVESFIIDGKIMFMPGITLTVLYIDREIYFLSVENEACPCTDR